MSSVCAIIVAAGEGKRFGAAKPFAYLSGKTILDRCLEIFDSHSGISGIVLVLRDLSSKEDVFKKYAKMRSVVKGGRRRQDSVFFGFQQVDPDSADLVLIHDAARPLVQVNLIERIIGATKEFGAAIPVLPVYDTIKKVRGDRVSHTIDRQGLYHVQTPQGFAYGVLRRAFDRVLDQPLVYTDESALVEKTGQDVFVVDGDPKNIKITVPDDIKIAEALVED
ncbi:MAG: 2-C-methyl-D-erythritol 4-phosphate cytidylyltransferase [Candidatus Aminicenantes bacterium]|jgi:2-C-methyl-D-erythritol 4-phosphate cytidylyltransferase